jgi:hypothetical protein
LVAGAEEMVELATVMVEIGKQMVARRRKSWRWWRGRRRWQTR